MKDEPDRGSDDQANDDQGSDDQGSDDQGSDDQGSDDQGDGAAEPRVPRVVLVEDDLVLRAALHRTLGGACQTLCVEPRAAVALLQSLEVVDVALVDCDQPPSVQAPIFRELARWPHAVCVLMSANVQKVEQLRALGVFAPLVLDKPIQPDALEAIRSATLELALQELYASESTDSAPR